MLSQYEKEVPSDTSFRKSKSILKDTLYSSVGIYDDLLYKRVTDYFEYFSDYYAKADALAGRYQARYRLASIAIYCFSALAVIAASAQLLFHLSHFVGLIEILAMIAILATLVFEKRSDWHMRWLDYRFFAERLRYGMYLAIFNEKKPDSNGGNISYLLISDSWFLNYYRSIWTERPASQPLMYIDLELLKSKLDELWLAEQLAFHRRKREKVLKKHKWISRVSEFFFWITLIAASLHFFPALLHLFHIQLHLPEEKIVNSVLYFFSITFPMIAATLTALMCHFDYKKTASRSAMIEAAIVQLQSRLLKVSTLEELQQVANDSETLMLQENSDWYVTIKLQKLEAA